MEGMAWAGSARISEEGSFTVLGVSWMGPRCDVGKQSGEGSPGSRTAGAGVGVGSHDAWGEKPG